MIKSEALLENPVQYSSLDPIDWVIRIAGLDPRSDKTPQCLYPHTGNPCEACSQQSTIRGVELGQELIVLAVYHGRKDSNFKLLY